MTRPAAGGGTRLKIVEAMAMGKAIVSTSLGAEGIEAVARPPHRGPARGIRGRGERSAPSQAETWEAINRIQLASARQEKIETGRVVRLDSTVTAALMHEPSYGSRFTRFQLGPIRHERSYAAVAWSVTGEREARGGQI